MIMVEENIVRVLIKKSNDLLKEDYKGIETLSPSGDKLINNIDKYPHAFVLGCMMDRQIKAERAWTIPYEIFTEIGTFEFQDLYKLTLEKLKILFNKKKLHRFNNNMAKIFHLAIQRIQIEYKGDASNIWAKRPRSATVVRRFLGFHGAGVKIATMAANILARGFKVPMEDYICIDISPDVHVKRVFKRLGFLSNNANNDELIYCARELNPEFPGILDLPCWEIGRNWCRPKTPLCSECYLDKLCPKVK